ncbi:protease modulator HflC [Sphingomonas lacunae]|uniref:Protein HflC n=1 Tax=Sphingomonas lacunae TaxID=2698828 RepID=A0A6M4ASJ4_9SPHN|nr:protease modulator HflC [Sphingomonas lacunae]QJQ32035.1 protease modulator HflC [Sphingomonas lacunae]
MGMVDYVTRHPVRIALSLLALAVIASMTFTVVPETKQGLILRYGQIEREVNPWSPRERFGATGAGLVARIPFVEQIKLIDKTVMGVTLDNQPVLSSDQLSMQVDAYARFRITDPRRMYESIRDEETLKTQLATLLGTSLRNELGKRTFASLLSPERGQVMEQIQTALARRATRYGVEIIDVRINRADLPDQSRDSVFARMRAAREQEATAIQAEGYKQARLILADADAEAARISAEAYGKDPRFYAFWRAMQSYERTFNGEGSPAPTFVLPPNQGYLSEFGDGGQ